MNCPICDCSYSDQEEFYNCESFDDSYLYKDVVICKCRHCSHLFNKLTSLELQNLMKYYKEEYAPSNLSSSDKIGDKPGSDNLDNQLRYGQLYEFILPYITKDTRILDIGCAMGGFLKFLERQDYTNLYGIEPIDDYVKEANNKNIKVGNVYSIPFEDNSFDLIILDQVLEHVSNLKLTMKEINRVLDKGGLLYIGVPDADRYNDIYFYIMREHIQHFNMNTINVLSYRSKFEIINSNKTECDMIGTLGLPNLSVLLKKRSDTYCWGIGREFMYLYPNSRIKYLDLILVDDTPAKQKQTFKGMKIHGSDILKEADKNSFLIITANTHKDLLTKKARELGFKGEIINV